ECRGARGRQSSKYRVQPETRIVADQSLRYGSRLDQEVPMKVRSRQGHRNLLVDCLGGHDVEERKSCHRTWMVWGKTVCDATTAVVPGEQELTVAKSCHDLDHVGRHCAL